MPPKKKSAWSLAAEAIQQQSDKTEEPQNVTAEEQDTGNTAKLQVDKTEEPQAVEMARPQNAMTEEIGNSKMGKQENVIELEPQNRIEEESQKLKTEEPQNGKTVKSKKKQSPKAEEPQSSIEEEKPTEKITLYLSWNQLDKLDSMVIEYKRRTRKRTDHNKLMRMMIDKLDLDDLL